MGRPHIDGSVGKVAGVRIRIIDANFALDQCKITRLTDTNHNTVFLDSPSGTGTGASVRKSDGKYDGSVDNVTLDSPMPFRDHFHLAYAMSCPNIQGDITGKHAWAFNDVQDIV